MSELNQKSVPVRSGVLVLNQLWTSGPDIPVQGPLHIMNYFGLVGIIPMWIFQLKWLTGNVTSSTFRWLFGMSNLYLLVIGKDYKSYPLTER